MTQAASEAAPRRAMLPSAGGAAAHLNEGGNRSPLRR